MQVGLVLVALAGLAVAPLAVPSFAAPPAGAPTALWLALVLLAMVGLPFFALSSASPTTQRWFAALPGSTEPYRLFAASNAGSVIGLLAYPLLVEPNLVAVGDGRLELARVAPSSFDLLVLDAFSSDSVPVHLLTVESFATACAPWPRAAS